MQREVHGHNILLVFIQVISCTGFSGHDKLGRNRPWASLYHHPIPRGFYHMVINIWVPWLPKYTVQVVCKWAVAVGICGAGSNKCIIWNSKLQWPCLLATHLLWPPPPPKKKEAICIYYFIFEQFNMLQLSVSLCLKCVLVIGYCGRRNIKVPSVKNPELTNVFP